MHHNHSSMLHTERYPMVTCTLNSTQAIAGPMPLLLPSPSSVNQSFNVYRCQKRKKVKTMDIKIFKRSIFYALHCQKCCDKERYDKQQSFHIKIPLAPIHAP